MILAEKIVLLRKMKGMSQEDLAEQLGVSRQSISKWEGAQTVPDLKRILSMAELFGVSTDTLLRDDMDLEEQLPAIPVTEETAAQASGYAAQDMPVLRQISIEEANEYLRMKNKSAGWIAIGVMLCILSPIALMQLSAAQEAGFIALTENQAAGIGLVILMMMIGCAVGVFVYYGMKMKPYEYVQTEPIETAYGVSGMVTERIEKFNSSHIRDMIIGILLCVMSCIPIFGTLIITEDDYALVTAVCVLLVLVATGVMLIVRTNIIMDAMKALLARGGRVLTCQEGGEPTQRGHHGCLLVGLDGHLPGSQLSHKAVGYDLDHLAGSRRGVRTSGGYFEGGKIEGVMKHWSGKGPERFTEPEEQEKSD